MKYFIKPINEKYLNISLVFKYNFYDKALKNNLYNYRLVISLYFS